MTTVLIQSSILRKGSWHAISLFGPEFGLAPLHRGPKPSKRLVWSQPTVKMLVMSKIGRGEGCGRKTEKRGWSCGWVCNLVFYKNTRRLPSRSVVSGHVMFFRSPKSVQVFLHHLRVQQDFSLRLFFFSFSFSKDQDYSSRHSPTSDFSSLHISPSQVFVRLVCCLGQYTRPCYLTLDRSTYNLAIEMAHGPSPVSKVHVPGPIRYVFSRHGRRWLRRIE